MIMWMIGSFGSLVAPRAVLNATPNLFSKYSVSKMMMKKTILEARRQSNVRINKTNQKKLT
jgi:hypothetical protein